MAANKAKQTNASPTKEVATALKKLCEIQQTQLAKLNTELNALHRKLELQNTEIVAQNKSLREAIASMQTAPAISSATRYAFICTVSRESVLMGVYDSYEKARSEMADDIAEVLENNNYPQDFRESVRQNVSAGVPIDTNVLGAGDGFAWFNADSDTVFDWNIFEIKPWCE